MRPVRWMQPTCGRGSKPMSPVARPWVSGCRAGWSRPCRCCHAPVHTGPLQLRRTSTGLHDPGSAASRSGPSACPAPASAVRRPAHNSTSTTSGRSSIGRAPVSNSGGWGFEALRPCESWKVPRAPDPRPGREAGEQRGTGLAVTWPWGHLSRPRPQRWGVGANSIVDSIRQEPDPHSRERRPVAAATHGVDVGDAIAADHASVGQLAGPPGCKPGPLAGVQVRALPGVLVHGGTSPCPRHSKLAPMV